MTFLQDGPDARGSGVRTFRLPLAFSERTAFALLHAFVSAARFLDVRIRSDAVNDV